MPRMRFFGFPRYNRQADGRLSEKFMRLDHTSLVPIPANPLRTQTLRLVLSCGLMLVGWNAIVSAADTASEAPDSHEEASLDRVMARQRMEKRALLKDALALSPAQANQFWPVYYDYQAQLISIYDRKLALIERYEDEYPNLTEQQADHLVRASLQARRDQLDLLERYYVRLARRFSKNLAARFVQIESVWNGAFDNTLQARLPLVPQPPAR